MKKFIKILFFLSFTALCFSNDKEIRLKLATTTSTENSGLLDYLLPEFKKDSGIIVDVISVGTGRAIKLGENGDVDIVLVHARALEEKFVSDGFGVERFDLMYNDFIVLGPKKDKLNLKKQKSAADVFRLIANKKAIFISRGDESGTHVKEKEIWKSINITPEGKWYKEAGMGMEEVINMANQQQGYTLADRGTYLSMKDKIDLTICYQGDKILFNPYGVIAVNPEKHSHTQIDAANKFIEWLVSKKGQNLIGSYKIGGELLFFPDAKK
jgi:tungstate transport system substrate-binding protein